MNEDSIIEYITQTFDDVETETAMNATFFFDGSNHMFPFTTLVTTDEHDTFSDLNRPAVYRLNIGVSKQTFRSFFGEKPFPSEKDAVVESGYDFTALDHLLPHPVYGMMYWVCILNPSTATFDSLVKPLLAQAYDLAVKRQTKHEAHA